jgi:ParB family chromosome partitioning protein
MKITPPPPSPVEGEEAMDRLRKKHNFSQDDLAIKFSKSKASISNTLSLTKLPPEVLDDCRKDPAMPKRVLVEIAQKRQERSMLTAYLKYKAELDPKKKTRTGNLSKAQAAFNAMDAVQQKIKVLDIETLTPEDKGSLVIALGNLKQAINAKLEAVTAPSKNLA